MYFARIEEVFFKYRRQGTILSPKNWLVAEKWEQMGIPLHIVCNGIKKACRQFRSSHKEGVERLDFLTYCEPEILRLWKEYRKALLGAPDLEKGGGTQSGDSKKERQMQFNESVKRRIQSIRADFDCPGCESGEEDPYFTIKAKAVTEIDCSTELDLIEREGFEDERVKIEFIEERLNQLDKKYISYLFNHIPEELIARIKDEAIEELAPYKEQMDINTYSQTLELAFQTILRERLNLKRISLYTT